MMDQQVAVPAQTRKTADAIPVMLWFARTDAECVYVNQSWVAFRGRPREQEVGPGWLEGLHPDDARPFREAYLSAFRERRSFETECRLRRADGRYRWVLVSGAPWVAEAGDFLGYFGSAVDITERREAEEKAGRLAAIIESCEDAIVSKTLDGTIVAWNRGAERIYGYTAEEIVGRPISTLYRPDQIPDYQDVRRRVLRGEQVAAFDTVRRRKDGRLIDVCLSVSPIVVRPGDVVGLSSISHDITKVKRLEQQFQQAQKMEAIGTLAWGVAHDFNNLLTIINGYSEVLIGRLKPDDPMRESLDQIREAGERAASLTRQLLAFSRQQLLEPRVLDLNRVVADTEKMIGRLIEEDIILTSALDPSLKPVRADPGQLQQVLMNLSLNARDAMPHGGRLTIETRGVTVDEAYAELHPGLRLGDYAMLAVSDNRCGMDETTKARIFEPFFTTKGRGKGTGLGLAVVYDVVKQSGGYIEVYSEVGKGTAFKVYLPAVTGPVASEKSFPVLRAMPRGNETVLLAEDEEAVRALALQVLRSCGYVVLEAADGQ
jgi:PAS domain S-box-containing protein